MIPESSHPTPTSPQCSNFMCSLPLQNSPASVFFWLREGSCHLLGTQVETSTITSTQLPSPAGPALTHFHHFPSPCWEACFGPSSLPQGSPLTPASLPVHSTVADKCYFLLQSSDSLSFQFRNIPSSRCPVPTHECTCVPLPSLPSPAGSLMPAPTTPQSPHPWAWAPPSVSPPPLQLLENPSTLQGSPMYSLSVLMICFCILLMPLPPRSSLLP